MLIGRTVGVVLRVSMKTQKERAGCDTSSGVECHSGHRKRMRQRYEETDLTGFHPHEVLELELVLFDTIPRANTNDLAHAMLDARREELAQVLLDPPSVRGIGEKSRQHLRAVDARMEALLGEGLSGVVGKSQFSAAAIYHLRRYPEKVFMLVTDGEDHLVSWELAGREAFLETLERFLSALAPEQVCHIAMRDALGLHTDLPKDTRLGMVLRLNERWQPQW